LDLKRDVVQPFGVGAAIFIAMNVVAAVLSIFGLAPTAGTSTLNASPQGVIGLAGTLWVTGKTAEIAPRYVRQLLRSR